jgi:hypothetical protein
MWKGAAGVEAMSDCSSANLERPLPWPESMLMGRLGRRKNSLPRAHSAWQGARGSRGRCRRHHDAVVGSRRWARARSLQRRAAFGSAERFVKRGVDAARDRGGRCNGRYAAQAVGDDDDGRWPPARSFRGAHPRFARRVDPVVLIHAQRAGRAAHGCQSSCRSCASRHDQWHRCRRRRGQVPAAAEVDANAEVLGRWREWVSSMRRHCARRFAFPTNSSWPAYSHC